ncbi:hypothetical protein L2E82_04427 [Cichorium intybus]|uniref:Uncharacterized protein n=1 Tax=Cichorium intybus TaxID=13427 RepID=A0ACB9H6J0_CICIN|nr:hypothetical protein L2E82_04427 [Cichorium intybus]
MIDSGTSSNLILFLLQNSEFCNQFYRSYFVLIVQEIIAVLTGTFHKSGFKLYVLVLQHLFCLVESGSLMEPLWDVATVSYAYPNNLMFVREYTIKLLGASFPNIPTSKVAKFVNGLFESRTDLSTFKNHIRDLLVQSKEFSAQVGGGMELEEILDKLFSDPQLLEARKMAAKQAFHALSSGIIDNVWNLLELHIFRKIETRGS